MARTRPQVMPAVTGTLHTTLALAAAEVEGLLDAPTHAALLATLGKIDLDLVWRFDYVTENQFGTSSDYWKGRRPADGDEDKFADMLVMDDQLRPAMAREVDAGFVKDPEWDAAQGESKLEPTVTPVPELTDWHQEADLTNAARDAVRFRWWAGQMVGRVYVPVEYQEQLTGPNAPKTLDEALQLIHVQAVDPREGGPIRDPHGRVLGYWYRYERTRDQEAEQVVEVHTRLHVLTFVQDKGGKLQVDTEADNPFHNPDQPRRIRRAEYLMWHADRDGGSALTRSVRDAQDRLNVVTTYMGRNDDQTGYRQIIVANAEPFKDRRGNVVPFPMGPGVAVNLKGLKKGQTLGQGTQENPDRHTPTWNVIEPLDPSEYHIPSINKWTNSVLDKLDQLWTRQTEAQVSGESKRQSRKPFDRRVAFGGQDTGGFIAWALRAALMLASQIIQIREYEDVTFQPKLFLDVDALNLDELRVKLSMWQAGALTLVSLLESTPGISDAAKEAKAVEEGDGTSPDSDARKAALERLLQAPSTGDGG